MPSPIAQNTGQPNSHKPSAVPRGFRSGPLFHSQDESHAAPPKSKVSQLVRASFPTPRENPPRRAEDTFWPVKSTRVADLILMKWIDQKSTALSVFCLCSAR
ncbi:hypothetical protein ILYODFUR_007015, partial [Ilyodon furcidens]